jgi:hypothetical protein
VAALGTEGSFFLSVVMECGRHFRLTVHESRLTSSKIGTGFSSSLLTIALIQIKIMLLRTLLDRIFPFISLDAAGLLLAKYCRCIHSSCHITYCRMPYI